MKTLVSTLSFNIHFNIALPPCIEPLPSTLIFFFFCRHCSSWCKVNYVSVSFPFCGCCLTPSTKLNTRSGCPLYNLASNSKDFPESFAKLLGMIFLYFGTSLTCCRYLFSFFQMALSHSVCTSVDNLSDCYCHQCVGRFWGCCMNNFLFTFFFFVLISRS